MTSRSLWTALLGTYNLVSFHFLCLILFEYDSKCERVSAFSVMIFCADSVQWGSKTGVDHCRSCQQGFCCSGTCLFDLLPNTSSYCPFQYFLGQKASGSEQPCGAATMLQTLDSGSHTMTCWNLWCKMHTHLGELCKFSSLLFTFSFHFTNPWLTFSLFCSVSFLYFDIFIHIFPYLLLFLCVCVFF